MNIKKIIALLLCGVLMCSIVACGKTKETNKTDGNKEPTTPAITDVENNDVDNNQESTQVSEGDTLEITEENGYYKDMGKIKEVAGYDVAFPDDIKETSQTNRATEKEIEIDFLSEDGEILRRITKSMTEAPDAERYGFPYKKEVVKDSVTYTLYTYTNINAQKNEEEIEDEEIPTDAEENVEEIGYGMATWSKDGCYYLYSVKMSITETDMIAICEKIK